MDKLAQTMKSEIVSTDDREKQDELQASLCGVLQALDDKIRPFYDQIMTLLLQNLQSDALHRSVKPPIFSCFGDISLAIGPHFERYLIPALQIMLGAAQVCMKMDTSDDELMDYGNQLRKRIFEAYSGILQGLKDAKAELMMPYAQQLLQFIEFVSRDAQRDESVMKAAVAAMGDLADALGGNTKQLFKDFAFCGQFLANVSNQKTASSRKLRFGLME